MSIFGRLRAMWMYILGASMLPLTYVLSAPCGLSCAICPLSGSCLFLLPPIVLGVILVKSSRRIWGGIIGLSRRLTSRPAESVQ
jgi:hypothetical protein